MASGFRDTRSEATILQQKLFQRLGTIARMRASLYNIVNDDSWNLDRVDCSVIHEAALVFDLLEMRVRTEMQKLPSKKNLQLAAKQGVDKQA